MKLLLRGGIKEEIHGITCNKKMKKNNSGLSLLEALISMVVVGIGFGYITSYPVLH